MTHAITSEEIKVLVAKLDTIQANADALHQKLFEANRKNKGLEARIIQLNADYEHLYEKVSELKRLAVNDDAGNWNEMRAVLDKICDI